MRGDYGCQLPPFDTIDVQFGWPMTSLPSPIPTGLQLPMTSLLQEQPCPLLWSLPASQAWPLIARNQEPAMLSQLHSRDLWKPFSAALSRSLRPCSRAACAIWPLKPRHAPPCTWRRSPPLPPLALLCIDPMPWPGRGTSPWTGRRRPTPPSCWAVPASHHAMPHPLQAPSCDTPQAGSGGQPPPCEAALHGCPLPPQSSVHDRHLLLPFFASRSSDTQEFWHDNLPAPS
mmetsp:Transcript_47575/g.110926  ORF Transcript_47575/g.110926 Transcript_47575/m.110926 type:complete len:230 (-) Transcript_47575:1659-2348(-)